MKKIIIIDDDDSTRESISTYLADLGYEIFEASNGVIGLELIKKNLFDLIISDIKMSGISGIELAFILKKLKFTIPIILISALENSEIKIVEKYIHSFFQKPLNITELKTTITRALINN